ICLRALDVGTMVGGVGMRYPPEPAATVASTGISYPATNEYRVLVDHLAAAAVPGDPVLVVPYDPGLFFLTRTRPAAGYLHALPHSTTDPRRVIQDWDGDPPKWIVWDQAYTYSQARTTRLSDYAPDLVRWIEACYEERDRVGTRRILERRAGGCR